MRCNCCRFNIIDRVGAGNMQESKFNQKQNGICNLSLYQRFHLTQPSRPVVKDVLRRHYNRLLRSYSYLMCTAAWVRLMKCHVTRGGRFISNKTYDEKMRNSFDIARFITSSYAIDNTGQRLRWIENRFLYSHYQPYFDENSDYRLSPKNNFCLTIESELSVHMWNAGFWTARTIASVITVIWDELL